MAADGDSRISERYPEDWVLCRTPPLAARNGTRHPRRAALRSIAKRRAGRAWLHSAYHLPRVLPEGALAKSLEVMPDEYFRSRGARQLAHGMPATATALLQRRRAADCNDPDTRLLGSVAALMNLLAPETSTTP